MYDRLVLQDEENERLRREIDAERAKRQMLTERWGQSAAFFPHCIGSVVFSAAMCFFAVVFMSFFNEFVACTSPPLSLTPPCR